MTETRSYRAFPTDLEIRADGRTLVGLVAPFNSPAPIFDQLGRYDETIMRGAFTRTISERGPERVRLLVQHDSQSLPIGRATKLREDAAGLYGEFRVSKTAKGDEVLELIRDQALDGLSIGFKAIRDQWSKDRSQRTLLEVRLDEVSTVNFPAYDKARVLAVRSAASPHLLDAYKALHLLRKQNPR